MDAMETNTNYLNSSTCLRTSIKRKLTEKSSKLIDYQDKNVSMLLKDDNHKIRPIESFKRLKKNLTEHRQSSLFINNSQLNSIINLESTKLISLESNVQQTAQSITCSTASTRNTTNHFRRRILKAYSNKKALKLKQQRKRSLSKTFLNLNNLNNLRLLNIFDTKSVYRYKFEQTIKKVFERIDKSSLNAYLLNDNDKNILDLNKLFQFDDSSSLQSSLKASFLGKGSFGKVFKTKLNSKCFAIKIGLSDSCYGCTGEQNALGLNDHSNVVKTHHILKLKIKSTDEQLFKNEDEFPITMSSNISYHTIKHIIDLNLLKLIDLFPKPKSYSTLNVILMEFAGDLSLQQLIDDSTNQKITKGRRIHFAKQIADALVYLKSQSIAHLDLKPANIMIRKTDDFLKLIDFGCSRKTYQHSDKNLSLTNLNEQGKRSRESELTVRTELDISDKENRSAKYVSPFIKSSLKASKLNFEYSFMNSLIKGSKNNCNIGTISHTAPEIFRNGTVKNIFQADVYSFSIILWQLVTREIPYNGDNVHSIIYRVASGKLRPRFDDTFQVEEKNYCDLTIKMWHNNPESRPNIEFIFQEFKRF